MSPFRAVTLIKHALSSVFGQAMSKDLVTPQEGELQSSKTLVDQESLPLKPSRARELSASDNEGWGNSSQEREQLLCRVAETVPDALLLYDLSRKSWALINRQLITALALPTDTIEQAAGALFDRLLWPDDSLLFSEHLEKCATMADGEMFEADYRLRHATGEWRWFHYQDTIFTRDSSGAPRQLLCIARDITNRKRNEEALRDEAVQAALGRWTFHVSYEINNPLANIKNILFLLRDALTPDHPDAHYLAWTEDEVERIAQTIRRLSSFSRANS